MSKEPRTDAGRALAEKDMWHHGAGDAGCMVEVDDILAIEAQAMAIDVERLAVALHNLHARSVIRMPKHGNPEHVHNVAIKVADEYTRLLREPTDKGDR